MEKKVVVIGGGPGGYAAALYCAHLGMKVTMVEKQYIGGTCLNVGCIPTKVFVQAANVYSEINSAKRYGISVPGQAEIDFAKTAKFKKRVVNQLTKGVTYLLNKAGVQVINGFGKLIDKNTVEVTTAEKTEMLTADEIIIATGSGEINIPGLETDGVRILNSTQMLDITELPESVAIIGGGVIGVEFASIFRRFGKDVTIVELSKSLIPIEDAEVAQTLKESLEAQGVVVMTETQAQGIESKTDTEVTLKLKNAQGEESDITVSQVLVCVGRRAALTGIGLEEAGVRFNKNFIETNEKMQTNIENIYAIGDITSSPQLAHVAYHEAKVAALNIAGKEASAAYHAVPGCIFSHPEVARVGMTEKEAREKFENVQIQMEGFAGIGKAIIEGEADGYIKMIMDKDSGQVVGCSIIGPKATELIAEPSLAVHLKLNKDVLAENIHAHPSLSEIIAEAAGAAIGLPLHS